MDKLSINLPEVKWGSINSKYKPESHDVGNDELTSGSYNFITNVTGALEKRPTSVQYNPTALNNPGKDQFEAIFASGVHHLLLMDGSDLRYTTGDGVVSTAAGGYTANANMEYQMFQNRVYLDNGVNLPSVYDLTANYGGVTYSVPQVKSMGTQPPVSSSTFGPDTATGITGSFHYKITFLYYGSEESNGGPASALHTVSNKTVNLTAIPIGGYGVTARNIYRDANDGDYRLVGTIEDNTTTIFADSTTAGTTPIPTNNELPPIWQYIALNLSRLWVAGVSGTPTTLYWSVPGQPDIFDPDNSMECNPGDPIQAIFVYQGNTIVLNRHSIGQVVGTTDDTFAYQAIPGSVGCTDNRSVQIRTISGVPILMWLSDRGVYGFNGSSVEYLSDKIEDEVNLNIQQSNFVNGAIAQSTAADFAAGTSSPGIDLATNPGRITTINPTNLFESESEWESGTLTNIATHDTLNTIQVPLQFAPSLASGFLSGSAMISGLNVQLPVIPDFTGESVVAANLTGVGSPTFRFGHSFTVPRNGTLTNVKFVFRSQQTPTFPATSSCTVFLYSDALGTPGINLFTLFSFAFNKTGTTAGSHVVISDLVSATATFTCDLPISQAISAGTYWFVVFVDDHASTPVITHVQNVNFSGGLTKIFNGSTWSSVTPSGTFGVSDTSAYTFSQTAISDSGSWQSLVYDSKSNSVGSGMSLTVTGSYPTFTTGNAVIEGSDDAIHWLTSQTLTNPTGTTSLSTSGRRYWRITYNLSTTDNRVTPAMSASTLQFNIIGVWVSPTIETTTDGTSFISMPLVGNTPLGTSIVAEIRTSPNGSSWTAYTDISLAMIDRYAQIRITLTATSDDMNTPSVVSIQLNWNLSSVFTSSIIDIGIVPTGWGIFQNVAALNGGTEAFSMRSASSSGAIPAATFYTVTNGSFPPLTILPLQFTQYRIAFTATPNNLPTVDSVTINYVTGINQSPIRVASLFFNKTYYLAAAEIGQTVNNVVISYDFEGKWRLFRGVNINSLSLFFNAPYYADAVRKFLYQWLTPSTGMGESIAMDVRSKAFDVNNVTNLKSVRSLRVMGLNTGTTIHAYYSVDRGVTWIEMLNVNGQLGYTTTTDGNKFYQYFVPDYELGSVISGVTIMFRVTSMDAFPCTLLSMEPIIYVRKGRYLGIPV